MKLDDIVLLGFVDEALKYLKNEVKENERPEIDKLISQLDIEQMKSDLNAKFGASFIGADEVLKALMKSGNEAFTDFTEKKQKEEKMMNELSNLFDNSFLGDETVKAVKAPKVNIGNIEVDEIKDEKPQIDLVGFINELKAKLLREEPDKDIKVEIKKEPKEEIKQEVRKVPKDLEIKEENIDLSEFKDTLSAIINHEEESTELPFIKDDDEVYNAIKKAADHEEENDAFEEEIEDLIQDNRREIDYDAEVLNQIINDVNEEEKEENNMYSDEHHNEYVTNLISDLQKKMDMGVFENTNPEEVKLSGKKEDAYTAEVHDQYVSNLVKDLQRRIEVEEEEKRLAEEAAEKERQRLAEEAEKERQRLEEERRLAEEAEKIYKDINDVYSHLPRKFVHIVYDARENIVDGLLTDQKVILLHRAKFDELDNLRQYAEILLTHDFNVNVDEHQMIVDAIKVVNNVEGKIVTNIFEVANQAYLLGGVYDGYRVIKEDDVNI